MPSPKKRGGPDTLNLIEGPEGVKWELGFACYLDWEKEIGSLGLGFVSEKKPKWEWD